MNSLKCRNCKATLTEYNYVCEKCNSKTLCRINTETYDEVFINNVDKQGYCQALLSIIDKNIDKIREIQSNGGGSANICIPRGKLPEDISMDDIVSIDDIPARKYAEMVLRNGVFELYINKELEEDEK